MRLGSVRIIVTAILGLGLLATVKAPVRTLADTAANLTITALPSPAGANSSEPQLTTEGDRVIVSWLEVAGDHAVLKFAERTPTGWSSAQTAAAGDNFFVNSYDVPAVRALADGTLLAQWIEKNGADPDASKIRLAWSKDKGATWSGAVSPHHDGTETQHGFASTFQAPGAGLGLVWLDGRATHPEQDTGDMALRASVYSPDGKQLREMVVDSRVCECCSTSSAETSDGVIVAYRDRSPNEVRDIYVTSFAAGHWSTPVAVHHDGWKLDACPINGPAVSAHGRNVAVAWFTAKDDKGMAFVAFSHDAGHTFAAPIRMDDAGSLARVGVIMLDDGSAAVTWIESASNGSEFRVRKITAAGVRSPAVPIAQTEGSRYPRLARHGNELVFAWTETKGDSSNVRTAIARIAP